MNPWYGYSLVIVGIIGTIVIRAPHGERSRKIKVVEDRKAKSDVALIIVSSLFMILLPVLSMSSPWLKFADYALSPGAFTVGAVALANYFWLFYRSHADLGTNWSISLEIRENHRLVNSGVYKTIRHPMYTSLFLYCIAQALLIPNWIAGPSCLVSFTLLIAMRVGPEERMMVDKFGDQYVSYAENTKRLIPFVY